MTKPTDEEIVETMEAAYLKGYHDSNGIIFDGLCCAFTVAKTMLAQQSAPDSAHVVFKETGK